MNPPPIGDALRLGWERFKQDPWPILLIVLIANVIFLIPIAGIGLGMPGVLLAGARVVRGQAPDVDDAFVGFKKPVDHIMIGLLELSGLLACCVGVLVTAPLFFMGHMLIVEKGLDWQQAMKVCLDQVKPQLMEWVLFNLVLVLFANLGLLACGLGVLVTAPICAVAMAFAYDSTLGAAPVPNVT
jgi:hypothetical protein